MSKDQFILVILSFIFGVMTTVITQIFSRRMRLTDARNRRRIEKLRIIQEWMGAYRSLFEGKYPDMFELVFAHKVLHPHFPFLDEAAALRVYQALKEYKEVRLNYEAKEDRGYDALETLVEIRWLDWLTRVAAILLRYNVSYYLHGRGLGRSIGLWLDELAHIRLEVFERFPNNFLVSIDWERLDFIDPNDVNSIIHTNLHIKNESWTDEKTSERESELNEERNFATRQKNEALRIITKVLRKVRHYEEKWLPPD